MIYLVYGYFYSMSKREVKEIILLTMQGGLLIIWGTYYLTSIGNYTSPSMLLYISFIVIALYVIYFIYRTSKKAPIEVQAEQINYWGITIDELEEQYKYKCIIKTDICYA